VIAGDSPVASLRSSWRWSRRAFGDLVMLSPCSGTRQEEVAYLGRRIFVLDEVVVLFLDAFATRNSPQTPGSDVRRSDPEALGEDAAVV
jgi:hypothetical protein